VPITEDQRAMLQLLLEGGQSYADIGSLLGVDASEVRSRARRALTEIGGTDPDAQVGLTDYLLGQADPIGRADAARHLQNDPAAAALATKLGSQLRLVAPNARLPELPGSPAQTAPAPAASSVSGPTESGGVGAAAARSGAAARSILDPIGRAVSGLGARERRLPVALIAGALLVLVVVLIVVSPFGGSDKSSSSDQASTTSSDVTIVKLDPVGGGNATGQAVFARVQDQPVLQINLSGLAPTNKDQTYIVWLYNSDNVAFPLARDQVTSDGNLTGAAPIPSQLIGLIGPNGFSQIDVSLASNTETAAALQAAAKSKQLPKHSGTTVLRGQIPTDATTNLGSGTSTTPSSTTPSATTPSSTTPSSTTP
jgi:hypothetical protein